MNKYKNNIEPRRREFQIEVELKWQQKKTVFIKNINNQVFLTS